MSALPRPMTYRQAADYLSSLKHKKWRGGLDRMEEFVRRAGLEEAVLGERPRFIHVTGTNGKGSTAAFIQSMLVQSGHKTGGYFSPYVYDIRERIQVDSQMISEEAFASLAERLAPIAETFEETEFGGVSEFEFKTAMGFLAWKEADCDWVSLEVGIGGRLDSTNLVNPACSVIVSIGLDHTDLLGSTHAEIAAQKAGIVKPGRPTVVGTLPVEAELTIAEVCRQQDSQLWRLGREITVLPTGQDYSVAMPGRLIEGLVPGLPGSYQVDNMALAAAAMVASGAHVSDCAVREGAKQTRLPGRFERRAIEGKECILDGAHNGESAHTIAEAIRNQYPGRPVVLLTAMLAGHDPDRFYRAFEGMTDRAVVTEVEFYRRVPAEELAEKIRSHFRCVESIPNSAEALRRALEVTPDNGILLITGSFYLLGDLYPTFTAR
ncbi:MAG: bifunctional folylpolyglutamate synthase/dihydrofolate synthase [Fimbriimonadaceae bacterium]|nr:bifunctional folylpolyglutamate synthase/dihydrofolate synthase [Fimbriimonadaceae bacterium]